MKIQDEEMQELIERGTYSAQSLQSNAYRIVFNGVRKEPALSLSEGFTKKITQQIIQLKEDRAIRKDYLWLGVGLVVFIIATLITIQLTNFKFGYGAFRFFNSYGGLLLFGAVLIAALQWLDKRLFHKSITKST